MWPFRTKVRVHTPEPEKVHAFDYVQMVLYQSAECPLHVGGVYQVSRVGEDGALHFRQCSRTHNPNRFRVVPSPFVSILKEGDTVQLRANTVATDHECGLWANRDYTVGTVDDFQRVFFHHQGCEHWHAPTLFKKPRRSKKAL